MFSCFHVVHLLFSGSSLFSCCLVVNVYTCSHVVLYLFIYVNLFVGYLFTFLFFPCFCLLSLVDVYQ